MSILISFPILLITVILQTTAVSRLPLVNGSADLMLIVLAAWGIHDKGRTAWIWAIIGGLMMSIVSATPWILVMIPYLVVAVSAQLLHSRIWQSPILAMLVITILGTLLQHILEITMLRFNDIAMNVATILGAVTVPSLVLNLILALPIYILVRDIGRWVYPAEQYE